MAELWNSSAGPKYFLLHGGFNVGRGMDMARLQMITKNKSHITEQAAAQISTLWACKTEHFIPPMAPGAVPTAMPAQVHFATLSEVLMMAIEFGIDSAPEICVERVRSLRRELKLVVERLNTYLQLHYMLLTPFETKVRNLLVEAINHGMDEGFYELAVQADELQGNHQDGAPMAGTGDVVQVPQVQAPSETAGVGRHVKFGKTGPRLEGSSTRTVGPAAKNARPRSLPGQRRSRRRRSRTRAGSVSPRHGCAGRRGMVILAAATGASTTTSTAAPTQLALPHPPPHQVSRDNSSSQSSRSRNRSSNLNSSPSSSSSRRRPRGVGFSSQAWPTSAGWLAAVGEAEADVETPTRGAAAPGEAVSDSLGSVNRQSRQQGEGGARTSWYPVRRRREVRGTSRCTQARVSFAGPVPR